MPRRVAQFIVFSAATSLAYRQHPKGGAACHTDWDCTLAGGCEGGVCVCDAAFTGANCTYFDMLPTPGAAYNQTNASSWGGRVNFDPVDAQWHLHASEFENGCGIDEWEPSSTIVHATSATMWGPYVRQGVVAPAFSHNAEARRLPDGTWLLVQIGNGSVPARWNGTVADCRDTGNGTTGWPTTRLPPAPLPGWQQTGTSLAPGPAGPFLPYNLTPWGNTQGVGGGCVAPTWNGSWIATAGGGGMGTMDIAPGPAGPWTHLPSHVLPTSMKTNFSGDEDPDIFMTARGYFHIVMHSYGWPCITGATWWADGNNNTGGCGAHWYSADGRDWMWSSTVLYNSTVVFADGTVRNYGRERPKVIMDQTATFPVAIMNGVAQHCCGNEGPVTDDHTFTLIVPLATPTPAPQAQRPPSQIVSVQ